MQQEVTQHVTEWLDSLKFNRFHGLVLSLIGITLIFDGYDAQIIQYIMPPVMKEWNLSPVKLGSIASYGFFGLMIGSAVLGMVADRIGRKKALLACISFFSVFCGASYFAPDYQTFCILRFFAGLGIGGSLPVALTLVSEYSPAKMRGKAVAVIFTAWSLGPITASLSAMAVIPSYGWRTTLLMGAIPLLLLPFLAVYLPESVRFLVGKGRHEQAIKELRKVESAMGVAPHNWTKESLSQLTQQKGAPLKELFKHKLLCMTILLWLVYFFSLMAAWGLVVWLPTLLVKAGYSLVKSYSFGFVQSIGCALGGFALGAAMDKLGRKTVLVAAYAIGGITVWAFGAASSTHALYIFVGLGALFVVGAQNSVHVVAGETYPTKIRSTGTGWALTVGRVGAIIAPLLGGYVQAAGATFNQFFIVFAIPCFICAFIVLFFPINVRQEALESIDAELAKSAHQKK